jgi:hypothetical protein
MKMTRREFLPLAITAVPSIVIAREISGASSTPDLHSDYEMVGVFPDTRHGGGHIVAAGFKRYPPFESDSMPRLTHEFFVWMTACPRSCTGSMMASSDAIARQRISDAVRALIASETFPHMKEICDLAYAWR